MYFENVLILGSKAPYKIPNISVKEIFSSNGSAELASLYNKNYKDEKIIHTCVIGARSFLKLKDINKRVIDSMPDNLIVRDNNDISEDLSKLFANDINIYKFTKREQFLFQSKFFRQGLINLIRAEYNYENFLPKRLKHIFNGLFKYGFLGVSSGFFALLSAAVKYPNSNLIISGLSFSGGSHYYETGKMTLNRGNIDKILMNNLLESIKKRILIVDKEIAINFKLKEFKGEILDI